MEAKPKRRRIWLPVVIGLSALCVLAGGFSAMSNRGLPQPDTSDRLSALDQARLLEALQLRAALGDEVWPDWGSTPMPVIMANDAFEFLIDYPGDPPADWALVAGDAVGGRAYYRRDDADHQNFAVQIGDQWTASMGTKSSMDVFLIRTIRDMLPAPLKPIFPYRVLVQPSETQIGGVLHETFHVYQILRAHSRLDAAEAAHRSGDEYAATAGDFESEWKQECALLADALEAETREQKSELVRKFLDLRAARRQGHQMNAELIDYERQLEWEEGVSKYIEVAILKKTFESPDYRPLPAMAADPDFKSYQAFPQRWSQEMIQLRYQTTQDETRLYVTGMAEGFLLDVLLPGWQDKYWDEGVFLEDLLRLVVGGD